MSLVYIGKSVPNGLRETGPAMHLGGGVWAFSVEPIPPTMGTSTTAGDVGAVTFALVARKAKRPASKRRKAKKGGRRG